MLKTVYVYLIFILALTACESSELHKSMEGMGDSYKSIRESEDLTVIKNEFSKFKAALETANAQKIAPDNQATFDEGMKELADIVNQLDAALATNDLQNAKTLFEQLGKIRKKYHKKLDVK